MTLDDARDHISEDWRVHTFRVAGGGRVEVWSEVADKPEREEGAEPEGRPPTQPRAVQTEIAL